MESAHNQSDVSDIIHGESSLELLANCDTKGKHQYPTRLVEKLLE